jgi:hypothetical protein
MNWINSWKAGNKKEKYGFSMRLGTITLLEMKYSGPCAYENTCMDCSSCNKFRFMILNFGLEF